MWRIIDLVKRIWGDATHSSPEALLTQEPIIRAPLTRGELIDRIYGEGYAESCAAAKVTTTGADLTHLMPEGESRESILERIEVSRQQFNGYMQRVSQERVYLYQGGLVNRSANPLDSQLPIAGTVNQFQQWPWTNVSQPEIAEIPVQVPSKRAIRVVE